MSAQAPRPPTLIASNGPGGGSTTGTRGETREPGEPGAACGVAAAVGVGEGVGAGAAVGIGDGVVVGEGLGARVGVEVAKAAAGGARVADGATGAGERG